MSPLPPPHPADDKYRLAAAQGRAVSRFNGRHTRRAPAAIAWWSRHGKLLLGLAGVLIVVVAAIVAYSIVPQRPPTGTITTPPPRQVTPNSTAPAGATNAKSTPLPGSDVLTADYARLESRLHAKAGVVVQQVGPATTDPVMFGDWTSGPAWSTIKVPLVITALRLHGSAQVTQEMKAAIVESDNAAAESIWEGFGDPPAAADKVGAVLHQTGDPTTVESRKLRPEYTAFGQTNWSLSNQTRFLAAAACDPSDAPVLTLMGQVDSSQKWGVGTLANTEIKGGWGPSPAGRYLVRQIAVLPTPHGSAVVAMAAEPDSGSFADGTQALTDLARWLQSHLDALPAASCGAR